MMGGISGGTGKTGCASSSFAISSVVIAHSVCFNGATDDDDDETDDDEDADDEDDEGFGGSSVFLFLSRAASGGVILFVPFRLMVCSEQVIVVTIVFCDGATA